jgi:hypothetical protein
VLGEALGGISLIGLPQTGDGVKKVLDALGLSRSGLDGQMIAGPPLLGCLLPCCDCCADARHAACSSQRTHTDEMSRVRGDGGDKTAARGSVDDGGVS